MESKPKEIDLNELPRSYSEEFSDVIGNAPRGITRWGMLILIIIISIILSVGFLVQYSDVIHASAVIQSGNLPKSVIARFDGKIVKIFTHEKQAVAKNTILAYMESTASHEEVLNLEAHLYSAAQSINNGKWADLEKFNARRYSNLGELQPEYQTFMQSLILIRPYMSDGFYSRKKQLILNDLKHNQDLHDRLEIQLDVYEKDLVLAKENFKIKEQLFKEKVLPLLEYKEQESKLLNKQIPFESVKATLLSNEISISAKDQELLQLDQQLLDQKEKFIQALNAFANEIKKWKTQYLLMSPDSGIAVSPARLIENQDVRNGQELFYITRPGNQFFGEMLLAQEKFGKVMVGQEVLIKLAGYPYQEYGRLLGKISYISDIPNKNNQYLAIVNLENGLLTEYGRKLPYSNAMTAEAEIITRKSRLIHKFLFTLRNLWNKSN